MSTPASAWARAISAYAARVRSLSTRPSGVSRPQCPWSVNSSRHRSLITVSASPTSATTSVMARLRTPAGSMAPDPVGVLGLRDAEEHHPAQPELGRLVGGLEQRRAGVLDDARHRGDRDRLVDALADEQRQHQLPRLDARLGDHPAQGRRGAQPARADAAVRRPRRPRPAGRPLRYFAEALRRGRGLALRRLGDRLTGLDHRQPAGGAEVGERLDQHLDVGLGRHHVDAQAVLLGGLGGGRADHGDHRRRVRLAGDADQVAHGRGRGEDHGVELAGLDRVARRRRRRRGAHGAVGRHVVALPAQVDQAGDEVLGGDVGARQEDAVDRVEQLVVLGPVGQQPGGGLLARRHQVGPQTPVGDGLRGLVADRGDLEAGEGAGVEAVLLELLAHGLDGVDGGEGDPLVAALDQAAHGLVHLERVAGRLDRDGRHLLGHRAVAAQPLRERAGLLLGAGHQHPPAEQRLGLEPRQRLAQVDHLADDGDGRRAHPGGARVGGDAVERRDHGGLVGGGAGAGHQHRRLGRAAGGDQLLGDVADAADGREQHEGAACRRRGSSRPSRGR